MPDPGARKYGRQGLSHADGVTPEIRGVLESIEQVTVRIPQDASRAGQLEQIIARQAAVLPSEQLQTVLRAAGRKLLEMGSSQEPSVRRGCLVACKALLAEGAGAGFAAEPAVLQEHLLHIHRALVNILRHASSYQEVEGASAAIGVVLSRTASEGGAGADIVMAMAYQSVEWLMGDRLLRRYAGALVIRELGQHVPYLVAPHITMLTTSIQEVLADEDAMVREAAAHALSSLTSCPSDGSSPVIKKLVGVCFGMMRQGRRGALLALSLLIRTGAVSKLEPVVIEEATNAALKSIRGQFKVEVEAVGLLASLADGDLLPASTIDVVLTIADNLLSTHSQKPLSEHSSVILKDVFKAFPSFLSTPTASVTPDRLAKWWRYAEGLLDLTPPPPFASEAAEFLSFLSRDFVAAPGATLPLITKICSLPLTPSLVRTLNVLMRVNPHYRGYVLEIIAEKTKEVIEPDAPVAVAIDALEALGQLHLQGVETELQNMQTSVVPMLQHHSPEVRAAAVRVGCQFLSAAPSEMDWETRDASSLLLHRMVGVAAGDDNAACRRACWKALLGLVPAQGSFLSSCIQCVSLGLCDEDFEVRDITLTISARLSASSPAAVPPRLRAALLSNWSELRLSHDPLRQAQAARSIGRTYTVLCQTAPQLIPSGFALDDFLTSLASILEASAPVLQAGLFDSIGEIAHSGQVTSSPSLCRIEHLAVSSIRGEGAHITTRPAIHALVGLLRMSGDSGEALLQRHPGLLSRLLNSLRGEDPLETRLLTMHLLGSIGAIRPPKAVPLLGEAGTEALPWGRNITHPDYHTFRVTHALLNILRQPRLRPHHAAALHAIQVPLKLLGRARLVELTKDIVKAYTGVADIYRRGGDTGDLRTLLKATSFIVQTAKNCMQPMLPELADLARGGLETSEPQVQIMGLQLIESLAQATGVDFAVASHTTIPAMARLLTPSTHSDTEMVVAAAFRAFDAIGGSLLRPHLHLIAQGLVRCFSDGLSSQNFRLRCLEAIPALIAPNLGMLDVAGPLVHALLEVLSAPPATVSPPSSPKSPSLGTSGSTTDGVWRAALRALAALGRGLRMWGADAMLVPAKRVVASAALQRGMSPTACLDMLTSDRDHGLDDDILPPEFPNPREAMPSQTDEFQPIEHTSIHRALQGFGSPALWLDNFSQTLLGESPRSALRAASSVARAHTPLANELFSVAFVAFCAEPARIEKSRAEAIKGGASEVHRLKNRLHDASNTRKLMIETMQMVLKTDGLPEEVVQRLLSLAEFYERYEEGMAAGASDGAPLVGNRDRFYMLEPLQLSRLAEHSGLHAKALHWAEVEVLRNNDTTMLEACRRVVRAVKALGIQGGVDGVLSVLKAWNASVAEKDSRLQEELGQCEVALKQYEGVRETKGVLRCLEKLGDWKSLLSRAVPVWRGGDNSAAQVVARAAWLMGRWDLMEEASSCVCDDSGRPTSIGYFFRAVVAAHRNEYNVARKHIHSCRTALDGELSAYLGEGYARAYDSLVSLQQLAELDEIVNYREAIEFTSNASVRAALLKNLTAMWDTRFRQMQLDPSSMRVTLCLRSLVVHARQNTKPWLEFAEACQRVGEVSQAKGVLLSLLSSDVRGSSLDDLVVNESANSRVVLALLRHEWGLRPRGKLLENVNALAHRVLSKEGDEGGDVVAQCLTSAMQWRHRLRVGGHIDANRNEEIEQLRPAVEHKHVTPEIWLEWAMLHSKVAQSLAKEREGAREETREHAVEAMKGFVRCIDVSLREGSLAVPPILRLLFVAFKFAKTQDMRERAKESLTSVPTHLWLKVLPQLVARLGTEVSDVVEDLMAKVADFCPHPVIYTLLHSVGLSDYARKQAANVVLARVHSKHPQLVDETRLVTRELISAAILASERWQLALDDAYARSYDNPMRLLAPLFKELRGEPKSLDDQDFQNKCAQRLLEAESDWVVGAQTRDKALVNKGWATAKVLCQKVIAPILESISAKGVHLGRSSPALAGTRSTEVAIPGQQYGVDVKPVMIMSFQPVMKVLCTKQRPRIVVVIGSDGNKYTFLLKGHEDLRLDERIMQLLDLVRDLLRREAEKALAAAEDIVGYPIVPLNEEVGLIGWVEGADDLGRVIRTHRNPRMTQFENKMIRQVFGIDSLLQWENLSLKSRVSGMRKIASMTDGMDLHRALWLGAPSSEMWLQRRTAFARSLAAMSMLGYVVGLGDRHLGNMLLQRDTGRVVHVDFGDCFDVARQRKRFAEQVPFRLTRQLQNALGVGGLDGVFRFTAEGTMGCLRRGRDLLMGLLEAFVHDPLIQWRLVANPGNLTSDHPATERPIPLVPPKKAQPTQSLTLAVVAAAAVASAVASVDLEEEEDTPISNGIKRIDRQLHLVDSTEEISIEDAIKESRASVRVPSQLLGQVDTESTKNKARSVVRRIMQKLSGTDFEEDTGKGGQAEDSFTDGVKEVADQVDRLIAEATDINNLALSYPGWEPWL